MSELQLRIRWDADIPIPEHVEDHIVACHEEIMKLRETVREQKETIRELGWKIDYREGRG